MKTIMITDGQAWQAVVASSEVGLQNMTREFEKR